MPTYDIEKTINKLKELLNGATPLPWANGPLEGGYQLVEDARGYRFAQIDDRQNRELIVEAINALPDLLYRLEDLQAQATEFATIAGDAQIERDQLKEENKKYRDATEPKDKNK